jgi:hypothetical protein
MKNISLIFLLVFLFSCKEKELAEGETISFTRFSLKAPSDWHGFNLQGTDSQVGGITNSTDTLYFDLGWYSGNFSDLNAPEYIRYDVQINGRKALIVKPKEPGKGIIGMYIKLDDFDRFNLYGVSRNDDEVLQIFRSVTFL